MPTTFSQLPKNSFMFNWICIIALAAAVLISNAAGQQKHVSRPAVNPSHKQSTQLSESTQLSDWEMDHPVMLLLTTEFLPATNDINAQINSDSSSN